MAVKFGGAKDYSAMQGPCPDGFHIPTQTEWGNINYERLLLGLDDTTSWRIYFRLPLAGYRASSTSNVSSQNSMGYYWHSTKNGPSNGGVAVFYIDSTGISNGMYRACGASIRPFKDEPVIPDSSWTVLYQGTGTAGIYHNSTLGLISISSNGTAWITIADKNLGATTVYNDGNTLSEANCGKYYQRGNNYGFPRTGTVTTSSTKVDASGYGPGNYYNSSTFITASASPYDWTSVQNGNLRGGETGVRPGDLVNAYIGEIKKILIDFLLVGGGGAGGRSRYRAGGGGGAGGLIYCEGYELTASTSVTIGAGGTGSNVNIVGIDGSGGDSCFGDIVAYGGGGGGGMYSCACGCPGAPGGSGGGAAGCNTTCACGCEGQGQRGGPGCLTRGGGGGGYACPGCATPGGSGYYGGPGGEGLCSDISGTSVWYASGGGGGGCTGYSMSCGGGCGACYRVAGCNATCYGSGGGGGGCTGASACCMKGGDGCQGIFIVRYPTACSYCLTGGCKYTCGDYTIHCFTSNGTLCITGPMNARDAGIK